MQASTWWVIQYCDPVDYGHQIPLSMLFSRMLEWITHALCGLPDPEGSDQVSHIAGGSLLSEPEEALVGGYKLKRNF